MDLKTSLQNDSESIIHIFSNENDKKLFVKNCELTNPEFKVIVSSDHSFSDKRISLTNEIALWLNKQKNE